VRKHASHSRPEFVDLPFKANAVHRHPVGCVLAGGGGGGGGGEGGGGPQAHRAAADSYNSLPHARNRVCRVGYLFISDHHFFVKAAARGKNFTSRPVAARPPPSTDQFRRNSRSSFQFHALLQFGQCSTRSTCVITPFAQVRKDRFGVLTQAPRPGSGRKIAGGGGGRGGSNRAVESGWARFESILRNLSGHQPRFRYRKIEAWAFEPTRPKQYFSANSAPDAHADVSSFTDPRRPPPVRSNGCLRSAYRTARRVVYFEISRCRAARFLPGARNGPQPAPASADSATHGCDGAQFEAVCATASAGDATQSGRPVWGVVPGRCVERGAYRPR